MALRRLAEHQPETFAFTAENAVWVAKQIEKYPPGRQASAVIPVLWRAQEQEGWISKPIVETVASMLGMPCIRVLEVATFYTMFNLHPVGEHLVQVCTTTPCWLRGSEKIMKACELVAKDDKSPAMTPKAAKKPKQKKEAAAAPAQA